MTDTITPEELEAIEIDWTQGVSENFERVKAALLSALATERDRADRAEEERKRFHDMFAECAEARDRAGYLGTVPDCIDELISTLTEAEERADKAEDRAERFQDALQELQQWANAYPLNIFPEPDFSLAAKVLADAGISLDAISASNMRHVLTRVEEITRAVLNENETGNNAR